YWWQYGRRTPALDSAIAGMKSVIALSRVSAHHFAAIVPTNIVFSERLAVLALNDWASFSIISSTIHSLWAHRPGATTHETRGTYFPEFAFSTFPFPTGSKHRLAEAGMAYHDHRRSIMLSRQDGLTITYNRFHDSEVSDKAIQTLRDLHVEMDK